ncbi:MAG: oligoendopeptidase F, partial [Victivallales bacterium]|nr:oligoendopeptidase F [Victivallales bacterium]
HAERHEPLTADLLESEYYDMNEFYHGLKADKLIGLEWARIPHMYYNFYVYKYATGMSAAIQLANRILKEGKPALDDYFGFLKAGGSRDVLDIMRGAGVDLEKPEPVAAALDYFGTIVDRLEKLC